MLDAELFVDRFQEPDGMELGIEYVGRLDLLAQVFQEAAAKGGLAGPDLAGNGHEPVLMHNGALQMGQGLLVPFAQIQIGRVGHQLEGSFLETEKARVHLFSMTGRTGSRYGPSCSIPDSGALLTLVSPPRSDNVRVFLGPEANLRHKVPHCPRKTRPII